MSNATLLEITCGGSISTHKIETLVLSWTDEMKVLSIFDQCEKSETL